MRRSPDSTLLLHLRAGLGRQLMTRSQVWDENNHQKATKYLTLHIAV
jgi:hypothetical protein